MVSSLPGSLLSLCLFHPLPLLPPDPVPDTTSSAKSLLMPLSPFLRVCVCVSGGHFSFIVPEPQFSLFWEGTTLSSCCLMQLGDGSGLILSTIANPAPSRKLTTEQPTQRNWIEWILPPLVPESVTLGKFCWSLFPRNQSWG